MKEPVPWVVASEAQRTSQIPVGFKSFCHRGRHVFVRNFRSTLRVGRCINVFLHCSSHGLIIGKMLFFTAKLL